MEVSSCLTTPLLCLSNVRCTQGQGKASMASFTSPSLISVPAVSSHSLHSGEEEELGRQAGTVSLWDCRAQLNLPALEGITPEGKSKRRCGPSAVGTYVHCLHCSSQSLLHLIVLKITWFVQTLDEVAVLKMRTSCTDRRVLKEPIKACHENWYSRGLEIIIWDYSNLLESCSAACQSSPDKIYDPYTSSLYSKFPCTNPKCKSNFIVIYHWEKNSFLNARDGLNIQLLFSFENMPKQAT